jgi:polar amino acid transport system ATP-binding protein
MLKLMSVNKSFKENKVLKDISFELGQGEILTLIGPSGAGKTTLLRCINGLEKCDRGTIEVNGEYLCRERNEKSIYPSSKEIQSIKGNIGMVFQNFNLFPHMTVLENIIEAPVSVLKVPRKEAKEKAMELLDAVGLRDKADAYPFELSGGQRQRAAIARACAMNPEIICFDEPTSALDPELTEGMAAIIEKLAADNMAVLIVTHDMSFVKRVAKRVIFMEDGRIAREGTREEFFDNTEDKRIRRVVSNM